ncbi:MAG: nuclear transport factor 2 family protein [Ferroplasma sp.]
MVDIEKLVKSYYTAVDSNDLKTLFSVFDDNIVYERPGYKPLVGMDNFKKFYEENRIIKEGHHTITNIIVHEPFVIVEGEFSGILKDNSKSATKFVDVYTFKNGKAIKRHTYFDGQNV